MKVNSIFMMLLGLGLLGAACSSNLDSVNTSANNSGAENEASVAESHPETEASTTVAAVSKSGWWQPALGLSWQWQLDGKIDFSLEVDVFDIDLFDTSAAQVAALQARGIRVICYISVGSWEDWRPDAELFPESLLGNDYDGWPGERWLDIRQIDLLAPIMRARLDECQNKGFDAIEPDNMDGYQNDTGFALRYADQLAYNLWLADEAHKRGLAIGLKNDTEQIGDLIRQYDFAMTEDCFDQGWCEEVSPFIESGKAVFAAEYSDSGISLEQYCPQAQSMMISAIYKNRDLDAFVEYCE